MGSFYNRSLRRSNNEIVAKVCVLASGPGYYGLSLTTMVWCIKDVRCLATTWDHDILPVFEWLIGWRSRRGCFDRMVRYFIGKIYTSNKVIM